jgi:hypothetical protein
MRLRWCHTLAARLGAGQRCGAGPEVQDQAGAGGGDQALLREGLQAGGFGFSASFSIPTVTMMAAICRLMWRRAKSSWKWRQ